MKKIALYSLLALGMVFSACDEVEEMTGKPQENPQEPIFQTSNLAINASQETAGLISLEQYSQEGKQIPLGEIAVNELPADYSIEVAMTMAKDEAFTDPVRVPATVEENVIYANPDSVEQVWLNVFGKSPKEREVYVRYAAYAVNGAEVIRIGNAETFYGPFKMTIQPLPSTVVIEDMYYLLGTINGWDPATAVSFSHSAQGVYDDPVFTLRFEITADQAADGWWWKIIPQSSYATGGWGSGDDSQFGVAENGDESLEGLLVGKKGDQEPGAGCLKEAGVYIMTINMEEQSYVFERQPDIQILYTPGGSNSWNAGESQQLWSTDATNYTGYVYLDGEFKFADTTDWSGINYGSTGENGTLSTDGGAGNLTAERGLYWASVNTADLTYTLTPVTSIGVIGNATPLGWDGDTALTPSEDFLTWTGSMDLTEGEYKFRADGSWDVNLGGNLNDLTQGGANLVSSWTGLKTVTLYLGQRPYTATVE